MTETPPNSEGEPAVERLRNSIDFAKVLRKHPIDETEANRRAILSVTKRRFKDEDVAEDAWQERKPQIVEEITRKLIEEKRTSRGLGQTNSLDEEMQIQPGNGTKSNKKTTAKKV